MSGPIFRFIVVLIDVSTLKAYDTNNLIIPSLNKPAIDASDVQTELADELPLRRSEQTWIHPWFQVKPYNAR